jgi:RNA recognition motif-containing protein
MADKNDVFVGNLTFNTTEEQLRKMFQFMGNHNVEPGYVF